MLFIDARNYYTVVDRTLNEWSEWQLKNLNAIVWLYRGETEKYTSLLEEYIRYFRTCKEYIIGREARRVFADIRGIGDFAEMRDTLVSEIADEKRDCKEKLEAASKKDRKSIQTVSDQYVSMLQSDLQVLDEAIGVAAVEDDGVDFAERMTEIHQELLKLQAESNELMQTISKNLEEMGI